LLVGKTEAWPYLSKVTWEPIRLRLCGALGLFWRVRKRIHPKGGNVPGRYLSASGFSHSPCRRSRQLSLSASLGIVWIVSGLRIRPFAPARTYADPVTNNQRNAAQVLSR